MVHKAAAAKSTWRYVGAQLTMCTFMTGLGFLAGRDSAAVDVAASRGRSTEFTSVAAARQRPQYPRRQASQGAAGCDSACKSDPVAQLQSSRGTRPHMAVAACVGGVGGYRTPTWPG